MPYNVDFKSNAKHIYVEHNMCPKTQVNQSQCLGVQIVQISNSIKAGRELETSVGRVAAANSYCCELR